MTGKTVRSHALQPVALSLERPRVTQGAAIHGLVDACKPLDLNSRYAYLLLCEHFAETCVTASAGECVVGFVSAYKPPAQEKTIFVWQVAVDAQARSQGVAKQMLRELLARPAARACEYLETTVSPSNAPSRRLFHSLARELGARVNEELLFAEGHFGGEDHECEMLIRIGPFQGKQQRGECSA